MGSELFKDFQPVSSRQWKQQIQYELKGEDFNQALVWESPEGIKVKPFYHFDEHDASNSAHLHPASFGIVQEIFVKDVAKSAYRAKDSLDRGADSLSFSIADKDINISELLADLNLQGKTIYFKLDFQSPEFIAGLDLSIKSKSAKAIVFIDPVGKLAREGNWYPESSNNFDALQTMIKSCDAANVMAVDTTLYQNAGANIVQQLAYSLAHINEYFNRLGKIDNEVAIKVSVGPNYFFEIAKIRALRLLYAALAKEYGNNASCHILAVPSKRNKTLYDYNVNMLRTTTECMSAILGGADAISNLPYDALYHKSNEFGERISRNQLLILKHESYFDKVSNPAEGSYYVESLTRQLAEKALVLFKDIEANRGFLNQLQEGLIQKKIAESAQKEQELFDSGKTTLLGTNRHPNKNDRMNHELELYPFVKVNPRKTLITPIVEKRLAEKMEQDRLESEKQ